jgi:arylsulfatase A-like enzyme
LTRLIGIRYRFFMRTPFCPARLFHLFTAWLGGVCLALFLLSAGGLEAAPGSRPNILLILADDMGFSDIGCYGGEIQTPNLDALARSGLRFTQFYNTGRCCLTRACLLTGLYPHQAGIGHMMADKGREGYRGNLNRECVTIAEALKPAGYATYAVGKWHVTRHNAPDGPKFNWPLQRGFDRFYGTIHGAGSYYDPNTLVRDNTMISPAADPEYEPAQYYYTHAISDQAVRFLSEHKTFAPGRPFFMYVAFTAAHWPMQALEKDIAKYRGRYDQGYEPIRQARYERARKLGLIGPNWALSPQAGDWYRVANPVWEARCMEVYAAMVDAMDQGVGRIVGRLKKEGWLDNTLILFLQDNGGCAETLGRGRKITFHDTEPEAIRPMRPDELQPLMIPKRTRDGRVVRQGQGVMPGPADTFISYGRAWANVSNTPFREYKHWVHEGGISTPLIVHWPEGIDPARTNQLESTPAHLIDIMATCVDVAGASYPKEKDGIRIQPMEGVSLRPAFRGRPIQRPQPIFWEHEGNRAVRSGPWKLVAKGPAGPWELYDMRVDRTELHDQARAQPDRVAHMAAAWETWARRARVLPWIWKPPYGQTAKTLSTRTKSNVP